MVVIPCPPCSCRWRPEKPKVTLVWRGLLCSIVLCPLALMPVEVEKWPDVVGARCPPRVIGIERVVKYPPEILPAVPCVCGRAVRRPCRDPRRASGQLGRGTRRHGAEPRGADVEGVERGPTRRGTAVRPTTGYEPYGRHKRRHGVYVLSERTCYVLCVMYSAGCACDVRGQRGRDRSRPTDELRIRFGAMELPSARCVITRWRYRRRDIHVDVLQ